MPLRVIRRNYMHKRLAERTGFEPAEGFDPFTDLANRRFRPLSHLSDASTRDSEPAAPANGRAITAPAIRETSFQPHQLDSAASPRGPQGLFSALRARFRVRRVVYALDLRPRAADPIPDRGEPR